MTRMFGFCPGCCADAGVAVATADASNARKANPRPVLLFRFLLLFKFLLLFIVESPTFVLGIQRNFKTSIWDDGIAPRGTA